MPIQRFHIKLTYVDRNISYSVLSLDNIYAINIE